MLLSVYNTGSEIPQDVLHKINRDIVDVSSNKVSGYALSNIKRRLKLIYGNGAFLKLFSNMGVTAVISIPMDKLEVKNV